MYYCVLFILNKSQGTLYHKVKTLKHYNEEPATPSQVQSHAYLQKGTERVTQSI